MAFPVVHGSLANPWVIHDSTDLSAVKESINKYGAAVLLNVFSAPTVERLLATLTADVRTWTGGSVDIGDVATWHNWAKFLPSHGMLQQGGGSGQLPTLTAIRFDDEVTLSHGFPHFFPARKNYVPFSLFLFFASLLLSPSFSQSFFHSFHLFHSTCGVVCQVRRVFEALHGTTDLAISTDALSLCLAPQCDKPRGGFERPSIGPQIHVDTDAAGAGSGDGSDTAFTDPCIQGSVALLDQAPEGATFAFVPRSHKFVGALFKAFPVAKPQDRWHVWTQPQVPECLTAAGLDDPRVVRAQVPAGAMVLWSSATLHAGVRPLKEAIEKHDVARATAFVCMMPRRGTTDAIAKRAAKRLIAAMLGGRTTRHNPLDIQVFPTAKRTYGGPQPQFVAPPRWTVDKLLALPSSARRAIGMHLVSPAELAQLETAALKRKPL